MQLSSLIGKKIDQTQGFLENGTRVPLSIISVGGNVVSQIKISDKEGYNAVQLGFGSFKKISKPMKGHIKRAGLKTSPRFFREIRADEAPNLELGSSIAATEIFEPGDIVDITGTSKGKGYAGVVKRHGFAGGPRTHGQSDRERAPGSIGQTTTPGRVYKGKRMAGRMGNEKITIKNLEVLDVREDVVLVRGLIPGVKGAMVTIKKVGKNKKFIPLWSDKSEPATSENAEESLKPEDQQVEEQEVQPEVAPVEDSNENADAQQHEVEENLNTEEVKEVSEETEKEENAGK